MDYHMCITDNYITVNRQRVDLYEAVNWAKQHCPSYITNDYHGGHYGNDLIDFFFFNTEKARKEMTWFILRWS